MKDIHVLYSFPLRFGTPGTGLTAWHQVTGLIRYGLDVTLYAASCQQPITAEHRLRETLRPAGLRIPIRPMGVANAARIHDALTAAALPGLHRNHRVDILHAWPLGAERTLRTAARLGIKTVIERPNTHTAFAYRTVRQECDLIGFELPRSNSHRFNARRLRRENIEYRLADKILCPSDFVARTFIERGFPAGKLARHQYGYDPEEFSPPPKDTRRQQTALTLVFLGRCEPRKGLHYALDAWLRSKACEMGTFYIAGSFVPGYRKLLSVPLAHPSVTQNGYCDRPRELLRRAHALILPTVEEGSALVTYEARACGCVLLVSEAAGAQCTDCYDALVHKPRDVGTLSRQIDTLATNRDLFRKLQANSLAGLSRLTWNYAARRLVQIYENLLGDASATNTNPKLINTTPK
jgi:glycosyltransferase involved in cell wall biosynthesis